MFGMRRRCKKNRSISGESGEARIGGAIRRLPDPWSSWSHYALEEMALIRIDTMESMDGNSAGQERKSQNHTLKPEGCGTQNQDQNHFGILRVFHPPCHPPTRCTTKKERRRTWVLLQGVRFCGAGYARTAKNGCATQKRLLCHYQVATTVLLPAGFVALRAEGLFLAVADGADWIGADAQRHHVLFDGGGTAIAEREIVFGGAALVAMAFDDDLHLRIAAEKVSALAPGSASIGADVRFVEI